MTGIRKECEKIRNAQLKEWSSQIDLLKVDVKLGKVGAEKIWNDAKTVYYEATSRFN